MVKDQVNQGKPLLILFGVIEPGTCLPMKVDNQVEDQFEKFQRPFDIICGIKVADDLGESKYSKNFEKR